jgi:hypothetical protein
MIFSLHTTKHILAYIQSPPHTENISHHAKFCIYLTMFLFLQGSRLTVEHVDTLWKTLIVDSMTEKARNNSYHWFELCLSHAGSRQCIQSTCEHIFTDLICKQDLSTISEMGFAMFRTYMKVLNFSISPDQQSQRPPHVEVKGIPQLWDIAVHVESEHVAMQAIPFLNQLYQHLAQVDSGRVVARREEYIANCMVHLLKV